MDQKKKLSDKEALYILKNNNYIANSHYTGSHFYVPLDFVFTFIKDTDDVDKKIIEKDEMTTKTINNTHSDEYCIINYSDCEH